MFPFKSDFNFNKDNKNSISIISSHSFLSLDLLNLNIINLLLLFLIILTLYQLKYDSYHYLAKSYL
jgi:hypothetical protein